MKQIEMIETVNTSETMIRQNCVRRACVRSQWKTKRKITLELRRETRWHCVKEMVRRSTAAAAIIIIRCAVGQPHRTPSSRKEMTHSCQRPHGEDNALQRSGKSKQTYFLCALCAISFKLIVFVCEWRRRKHRHHSSLIIVSFPIFQLKCA